METKLNIAHIVFSFNNGGIEHLIADLINKWNYNDRITLIIINNQYNKYLIESIKPSCKIILLNREEKSSKVNLLYKLNKILNKNKYDIIHIHQTTMAKIMVLLKAVNLKSKIIYTIHDVNIFNKYNKFFIILMNFMFYRYTAISKPVYLDIFNTNKHSGIKTKIIYNGIDFSKYNVSKKNNDNNINICMIARIDYKKKGQDLFIKAANLICNKYKYDNVFFNIYGDINTDDYKYLIELINSFNLNKKVCLLGDCNNVPLALSHNDLFVLPSRFEGFGISIIESIASKTPCLFSCIDGPKELYNTYKLGNVFKLNDYEDLANKIILLINENNKEKIENDYEIAKKNFNINKTICEFRWLYCDSYKGVKK